MKKLISLAIILTLAASIHAATVTISGSKVGSTVTINYSVSGPNSVRGFAMDITASTGTITAVNCTSSQPLGYYIYPGSIQIQSGSIASYGDCVCSSTYPATKGGEGTSAVTVEMSSLYTGTAKPASSGQLLTLTLSNSAACVVVSRNVARGGIVMERPEESAADNLPVSAGFCSECLNSSATEYNKWGSYNKPVCWCYRKNCRGDADGLSTLTKPVMIPDLNIFKSAYNKTATQIKGTVINGVPAICADFDRLDTLMKPVMLSDLNIFKSYVNKAVTQVPQCDAAPVTSGPYNFWTN